jgi:hypothetical protein
VSPDSLELRPGDGLLWAEEPSKERASDEGRASLEGAGPVRAERGEELLSHPSDTLTGVPDQAPTEAASVKLFVDAWDPSYGSAIEASEAEPTGESTAQVRANVEREPAAWAPVTPPPDRRLPSTVLLVDGVRRIDAHIWVEEGDGTVHAGLAASYAAGVVRCDLRRGSADVAGARVVRGFFTSSVDAEDITASNARYHVHRVASADMVQIKQAIQGRLRTLETEVSALARATTETLSPTHVADDDLLVLDGPLTGRDQLPRALGYVKTHRVQYLPPDLSTVVNRLGAGQRTPVFLLGTSWHRYTWYLRLPGAGAAPWAGVVRVECSADLAKSEAIALADLATLTLPRFASSPYKDPRAPQNLTPIAGLERKLRGMLGDQRLLLRGLTAATTRRTAA